MGRFMAEAGDAFGMTSGRHPFRKASAMETFSAVLAEPPALGGDIPPRLTIVLGRLLAKDVESRYKSIAEVRADFLDSL